MSSNRGLYATACETSKYKNDIDKWLNEGRSNAWISRQLEALGEKISGNSIAKYKGYREQHLQEELSKDPVYQAQILKANETLIEEVGKFKQINVMNHISQTIEHCAQLLQTSQDNDIQIRNVQDIRYIQMSMLESIKVYGEMLLKAQAYAKIEEDPTLLRPTNSVVVKSALVDMLGGMNNEQRAELVDRLRGGIRTTNESESVDEENR
jgi:hypothetical protein